VSDDTGGSQTSTTEVGPARAPRQSGRYSPGGSRGWLLGLGVGLALVAAVAASLLPFRSGISRATPALLLVLPVVAAGILGRRIAAVATAMAGAAVYSFAFVPPYDRVSIAEPEDVAALVVFVLVAVVVGTLMAVQTNRRQVAEDRAHQIRILYDRNVELSAERERLREEANRVVLLEHLDRQRSALLRSVSHDLRTPLATIQAVASDLRDDVADPGYPAETRQRLLGLVSDEAERLNRIVANLLSLSRIESGSLLPERQAVAIDELVSDRLDKLRRLFRDLSVVVDLSPGLPLVNADYSQLDQVISNLLENAARHAPPRSTVHIAAEPAGQVVMVTISDEGTGVAPEEREHIFEPFRRGPGSASSGVGLAICKAMVEANGGTISVGESESGGARFDFTVPLHA